MSSLAPSTSALQAAQLFNVDGLVAVITGGGTGKRTHALVRISRTLTLPQELVS
jgi:ATP:corrinoid adenosyltransferase